MGGGITGLATAFYLAKTGRFVITLFEKNSRLGGLSTSYQWEDITWDKFYHVILSTDTHTLDFIDELGLTDQLFWRDTKSGFYGNGKLVSMSSVLDLIKFPFLTFYQKARLAFGILYSTRIRDISKLDRITVREWLTKVFGRRVYETIWDPLIRSKLGSASKRTSAAFIWATIKRLYGTRKGASKREKMGHVVGGYATILKAAQVRLESLGVSICTDAPVSRIFTPNQNNQIESAKVNRVVNSPLTPIKLKTPGNASNFEKVIYTGNCHTFDKMLNIEPLADYRGKLKNVEYLGIICVFLVLSRGLSPYYVTNILDKTLPFTGIIEVTNIVIPEYFGQRHIVYLPKYVPVDDPAWNNSDRRIKKAFIQGLSKVFPDLRKSEILHATVFREAYVQPLQKTNQLYSVLDFAVISDRVYLVNTSMLYNTTLNNNAAIKLAKTAIKSIFNQGRATGQNTEPA